MSGLPRPDLPAGPHRELVDALHDLHHRAGWPSLRALAEAGGCSHTTVSRAFSSARLPPWGLVEVLVEAMHGNPAELRELWLAATRGDTGAPSAAQIAGRRAELAAVRRHLESGSGLLVVAGEAGVGKTRLVTTAADTVADVLVVRASCLPLATEVPLLPWAEALHQVAVVDEGSWLREALSGAPSYITEVLSRLVPDLAPGAASEPADDGWRQRLFLAIATAFSALRTRRRWALLLEDLHWADPDTLDLLEHLLARGATVPVLGTWRLDDPDVRPTVRDWWARMGRTASVVELGPLARDETAAQLELLTGTAPSATDVERIHARTLGLPLFTEQLAAAGGPGGPVPRLLDELLVHRLEGLSPEGWALAAVLGAADRDLDLGVLSEASALDESSLSAGLHELTDRYLLRDHDPQQPGLRHPLLAEAVRRRLVGPESASVHRRLAVALGRAHAPAAETAEHWQRAGDPAEELHWRIAAANEADERFAPVAEWAQWRRALELWTHDTGPLGPAPGLTLVSALTRASDTARSAVDFDAAGALAERLIDVAAGAGVTPAERAAALRSAAMDLAVTGETSRGATLLEASVDIHRSLGPTRAFVEALYELAGLHADLYDPEAALVLARESVDVAARLGEEPTLRMAMAHLAWQEGLAGHHDAARTLLLRATTAATPGPPYTETSIAMMLTALTGMQNAAAADIERAGRLGLEVAERWELDGWGVRLMRSNLAQGYLGAGLVARAASALGDLPDAATPDDTERQVVGASIEVVQGRFDAAATRLAALSALPSGDPAPFELVLAVAELDAWRGDPGAAAIRLEDFLSGELDGDVAPHLAGHVVLLAQVCADRSDGAELSADARMREAAHLRDLVRQLPVDPLGVQIAPAPRRAWRALWSAELARLEGTQTTQGWAAVAAAWDQADRPHRAAYCRWRAARTARGEGQATVADRLLRRAARDARGHVPLSAAIAETASYARGRERA